MASLRQSAMNEIVGMKRSQGWTPNNYTYFAAQFSKNPVSIDIFEIGGGAQRVITGADGSEKGVRKGGRFAGVQAVVRFGKSDGTPLVAQVGLSKVSEDKARENLTHDVIRAFDFDGVCAATKKAWDRELAKITVEGGTDDQMAAFYTASYHTRVVPNLMSDADGQFRRQNLSIGMVPEGRGYYSTLSLWDTFRAWHPLMTLTDRKLVEDMVWSMLDMYDATGELPIWPLANGETWCMIGYHSVSVIADAWLRGIRSFDGEKALEAMIVSSNKNRKGSQYYTAMGYIPCDKRCRVRSSMPTTTGV